MVFTCLDGKWNSTRLFFAVAMFHACKICIKQFSKLHDEQMGNDHMDMAKTLKTIEYQHYHLSWANKKNPHVGYKYDLILLSLQELALQ